jgi:hypothetical protein
MSALLFCRLRVGLSDFECSGSRDVLAGRSVFDQEHAAVQDAVLDWFQVGGSHVREGRLAAEVQRNSTAPRRRLSASCIERTTSRREPDGGRPAELGAPA